MNAAKHFKSHYYPSLFCYFKYNHVYKKYHKFKFSVCFDPQIFGTSTVAGFDDFWSKTGLLGMNALNLTNFQKTILVLIFKSF